MTIEYFSLADDDFSQDWSNTGLILANDSWVGVPSLVGYRGDNVVTSTGRDPRTATGSSDVVNVFANRGDPNTFTSGGVVEFDGIPDPTIALQGSGTADAPHIVLHLDATGRENIVFSTRLRDLDTSTAVQPIAVQYRIGDTGAWLNVEGGYVANANVGVDTLLSVLLPPAANGVANLQVRVITTDAVGSDAFIGVDDIVVTSEAADTEGAGLLSVGDQSVVEGNVGTSAITFTVNRDGGAAGAVSATYTIGFPGGAGSANAGDLATGTALTGTILFAAGETSRTITLQVQGDLDFEGNETFTVTLSAPTGGVGINDGSATGTIRNDDAAPPSNAAFINEIHYDPTGTDAGEAIEVAGVAGTDLSGWRLVLYNGNGGASYSTIALTGSIPDQANGYGALSFASPGLQNGSPDGIALVDGNGNVVQFLSYEGTFTATEGPATGMTSTDIGVSEEGVAVGSSLQLTGTGGAYDDFSWADASGNSFGMLNPGQTFIPADGTGLVSVRDTSVIEGDDGSRLVTFTVRRAGGSAGTASADYTIGFGTADAADLAPGAVLNGTITFAAGQTSRTITVPIAGDLVPEANETLLLTLSNATGPVEIVDGNATATIINDDPVAATISEIQGLAHSSAFEGQTVITNGIVTAIDSNGFYLQDSTGDGNAATSDAIFVFTGAAPTTLAVGHGVQVRGTVSEFLPGGDDANLSITQISASTITVASTGNTLPSALVIGTGGLTPPSDTIDDDGLTSYDPTTDGVDFYESLEGMRVTIDAPLVVANTNDRNETFVVASGGAGATGLNDRGGITISEGDFNPERIQLDDDQGLFAGFDPDFSQGDRLSDVTGILSYSFGSYELLVTEVVAVTSEVTAPLRETTSLVGTEDRLTIATYNLENIDPTDSAQKFDLLANDIVYNLSAPDIIGVQEIQDANGAASGGGLSGAATAQILIDAIVAAGGPRYVYVEVAPSTPNSTGGEPNGNIRNGFLYNADRVSYIEGSVTLVPGLAFNGTRSPLSADFSFNGQTVTAINVHFTSRIGSDPLFGSNQPPADAGDAARTAQAEAVRDYVDGLLAADPALNIAVLGDFNGFYFEDAVGALEEGGVLADLSRTLPEAERYSYLFDGNYQQIDHILVTGGLQGGALYDAVHLNAHLTSATFRGTDHDAQVASLFIPMPNRAPTDLAIDGSTVAENAAAGTLVGTLDAEDADGDVLAFSLVDDAGGRFALDSETGELTIVQPFDFEAQDGYTIIARADDGEGGRTERTITISVLDVNEAPVAVADAFAIDEDATSGNLWDVLLGNDSDPDNGAVLSISNVDGSGARGSLVFDPATQTLLYVADDDSFDALAPGETAIDRFTYTVTDGQGLTSTATVEVTVTGVADGVTRYGTFHGDLLTGTGGEDTLYGLIGSDLLEGLGGHDSLWGGIGNDVLRGGDGNDLLSGGIGNDRLDGGNGDDRLSGDIGNDVLTGGDGADAFSFSWFGGRDTITDFEAGVDTILLENGINISRSRVSDVDRDGVLDTTLTFDGGSSVILLGVGTLAPTDFARGTDPLITETLF